MVFTLVIRFHYTRSSPVSAHYEAAGINKGTEHHAGAGHANVLTSFAQYENEVCSERVRAGQDASHITGRTRGGSRA